jgi:hypothetical protein
MAWAKWLQETRQKRFGKAYTEWQERRLTQEEAARLPGVCEDPLRRSIDRYEEADRQCKSWVAGQRRGPGGQSGLRYNPRQ